jgi:hypothetical protein
MEILTLTTPEVRPAITTAIYRVVKLNFDWEAAYIFIGLRGENGELKTFTYGGPEPFVTEADRTKAITLMTALNKANLSIKSLQRRVIEQLVTDGKLDGAVSGSPD